MEAPDTLIDGKRVFLGCVELVASLVETTDGKVLTVKACVPCKEHVLTAAISRIEFFMFFFCCNVLLLV
jgi:hypothetical protein